MNVVILHLILFAGGVWSLSMKSMTGCDEVCGIAPEPNGGGGGGGDGSKKRRVSKCLNLMGSFKAM